MEIIYTIFEVVQERKFTLVGNTKDNRVFMSRNYLSDCCPLEI